MKLWICTAGPMRILSEEVRIFIFVCVCVCFFLFYVLFLMYGVHVDLFSCTHFMLCGSRLEYGSRSACVLCDHRPCPGTSNVGGNLLCDAETSNNGTFQVPKNIGS